MKIITNAVGGVGGTAGTATHVYRQAPLYAAIAQIIFAKNTQLANSGKRSTAANEY